MGKSVVWSALQATILVAPCLAACGGGGGPVTPGTPAPTTTATTASTQPTYCCSALGPPSLGLTSSTGIAAGPIAAPPSATFGTASAQTAIAGGPTMDGKPGSNPVNVTFPLISTGVQAASAGLSALAPSPGATVTVTSSSSNYTLQLVIPSANINATISGNGSAAGFGPGDTPTWGYSYVVMGEWSSPSTGRPLQSEAAFAFGYDTPASAMPTSGTGAFSGYADAVVFKSVGTNVLTAYVNGFAAASVNFGSGQITGAITQMQQGNGGNGATGELPWNDVSVNANIVGGTNRFSGTTAATSNPGTGFSLSGSATGHIDGAFYGPAAQNVGAVWSLSDGTLSAFGTLGAKQ